jgi:pyruvate/2-oxoglutarate dehydrogenase complex dihydrolipoamide dehydrogenase (E3) component
MAAEDVDVVVIGMGPGGEDVAARVARGGLDVIGIDRNLVGGECPYYGCIPTKMMVRAAGTLAEARRVDGLAGRAVVEPDWAPVASRIRDEATDDWDDTVAVERFEKAGGRFVRGTGRITAPGEVTVGDRVFRARRGIVISTGTDPAVPPIDGLAGTPYWTNRDAVAAERVPTSMVVLGAGAIGVEFAQVFARFGAAVSIVEAAPRLLPSDEPEAGELLASVFAAEGITVRIGARAESVRHGDGGFTVRLAGGEELTAERLLVATGRRIDLAGLGVGAVGLDESARFLTVDDRLRAADGVWAVGDVTGQGAFTHVAVYQAPIAAADILGRDGPPADHRAVPRVTFTDPEVGAVGLTEAAAREQGIRVRIGIAQVPSTARGWLHRAEGVIKLVEDADRGVLVGATSAGPVGGEVLGALAVAVHAQVPTAELGRMIWAYPTFHRGIEDALRALARPTG